MTRPISRLGACLCLAASMALVGANVPFTKDIAQYIAPLWFALLRFVIAGVALLPLVLTGEQTRLLGILRVAGWRVTAMALIGMIGFTLFLIAGLQRTSGMNAGVIMATLPGMVTLLGMAFMGERPNRAQLTGVACAIAGVALIQLNASAGGAGDLLGNLLIVCAVLCEAGFVILAKGLAERHDGLALAFLANVIAGCLMVPVVLISGEGLATSSVPTYIWPLMIWYALAASVFSLLLWYRGLPGVETSVAGIMTAALPVSALAMSALYLGEVITALQALGALVVIAGIVIGSRAPDPIPST